MPAASKVLAQFKLLAILLKAPYDLEQTIHHPAQAVSSQAFLFVSLQSLIWWVGAGMEGFPGCSPAILDQPSKGSLPGPGPSDFSAAAEISSLELANCLCC